MDIVEVKLGERSYPIYIGSGILQKIGSLQMRHIDSARVIIVTNPTVAKIYLGDVLKSLSAAGYETEVIEIPDGEEYKSLTWAGRIFDKLVKLKIDRRTPLIALGGGVIGDMTGFVAATYLRGVPYIQIPTTLLAQVDSSVGGKTAVNHRKGKNLIGAFYQPKFVLIDVETLKTLDMRDVRAGLAEVVKYGVIRDEALFGFIEKHLERVLKLESKALRHIVQRACRIKADIVEADEREEGLRALLNFGHTLGHAIEAATKYRIYRHGEAVGLGMMFAASLSHHLGTCESSVHERLTELLKSIGLVTELPRNIKLASIRAIGMDKKVAGEMIKFIVTARIGHSKVETMTVRRCRRYLKNYSGQA